MKLISILPLCLLIMSCGSDNLSNSKAEKIISKCIKASPEKRIALLNIDEVSFGKDSTKLKKYKKLEKGGYIKMIKIDNKSAIPKPKNNDDPLANWRYEAEKRRYERQGETYNITITNKGEKYIETAKENRSVIDMKSHVYVVNKVLEVQEIPSMNSAKVKVRFEADKITPFAILSKKDPTELWIKDISMKKTSNGWKYCDDY